MVKEKSDKKKKEAPALTEVQEDIEMGDVAPEKVCYIQALYNSCFDYRFHHSHLRKRRRRRKRR